MMNEDEEYLYSEPVSSEQLGLCKERKGMNKKRFSDKQIKSLETIFEADSKLEPRKKLQVARDLGLQPRQVAIWFQNKRARYKSKQLERDYGVLRANYDDLASRFKELNKENQALQMQLQKLNDQMTKSGERNQSDGGDETKCNFDLNPTMSLEDDISIKAESFGLNEKLNPISLSLERSEYKADYFGLEEKPELLSLVGPTDSTLASPENWGSLDSENLIDQSGSNCHWWDVWS